MFVKTLIPHISIDGRTYPEGSVVETDKQRHDELLRAEHAETHAGPAFEPEPEEGDGDSPEGGSVSVPEEAVSRRRNRAERAVKRS